MTQSITEDGLQLYSRLQPSLSNILPEILPSAAFKSSDVIEICGKSNSGKTVLLMELIARAIIPIDRGGRGCKTVFIDLTANFNLLRFLPILEKHILQYCTESDDAENVHETMELALANLQVSDFWTLAHGKLLGMVDQLEVFLFLLSAGCVLFLIRRIRLCAETD